MAIRAKILVIAVNILTVVDKVTPKAKVTTVAMTAETRVLIRAATAHAVVGNGYCIKDRHHDCCT